ncbi:hypothetical protein C2G38_2160056 [Gigaspora rosea]|uniref:Uncharacterized protein n=1 Tax=Gigaspora rosea TaxID=44941 RepID=A0A397W220_9GLOM|nr:hypothetical protein C2G38_2160056 [Gigaspora rosea]
MEETILFNGLGLLTMWKIDDKSHFVSIDSSGLKVKEILTKVTIEFFCSGSGKPYGPTFTIGVAIYLPNNLDNLKNNSYPCIGLRSQDASFEANFGRKKMVGSSTLPVDYLSKILSKRKTIFLLVKDEADIILEIRRTSPKDRHCCSYPNQEEGMQVNKQERAHKETWPVFKIGF